MQDDRSGNAGVGAAALRPLLEAARTAWQEQALPVCIDHLEAAAALLARMTTGPDDRLPGDVVMLHARALDRAGRFTDLIALVERHRDRMAALSDHRPLTRALCWQARAFIHAARFDSAGRRIEAAEARALAHDDADGLAMARIIRMDLENDRMGGPAGAMTEVDRLFALTGDFARSGRDPYLAQLRLYEMSACYRQRGDLDRALSLADRIIALGDAGQDARALAHGHWARASILLMAECAGDGLAAARRAKAHARPDTVDHVTAQVFEALARLLLNDRTIRTGDLDRIAAEARARGDVTLSVLAGFNALALHFIRGRIRAGLAGLAAVEAQVRAGAERGMTLQFLIKKAELHLTVAGQYPSVGPVPRVGLADMPAALKLKVQAVPVAAACYDEIDARFDLPDGFQRARVSLGRGLIARARRRPDEARRHLGAALAWFQAHGPEHFATMARAHLR